MRLIAQLVEDDVVDLMVPFVTVHIASQTNWRQREAAVMAFGAVLEVRRRRRRPRKIKLRKGVSALLEGQNCCGGPLSWEDKPPRVLSSFRLPKQKRLQSPLSVFCKRKIDLTD